MDLSGLPKWVAPVLVTMTTVAILPFVLIAKARTETSAQPRVELIQNMDNQPRFKAQQANPLFADGRAMRRPVPGTIARGELREDEHLHRGVVDGEWAAALPVPVTEQVMLRGQRQYDIYCAPCHGQAGYGDGMVARRADELQQGTWIPPTSLHLDTVRERADGYLFNVITNGVRNMPAYGPQVNVADRWAIVAYIRALQRSQNATPEDVPADRRSMFR
jgi:mono/diheme cytochrome c family protein